VTGSKIGSGQVANSDLGSSAVTGSKISDTAGVASVDIVNGQVTSSDIADGTITSTDIAPGTIPPDGGLSLQVTERSNSVTLIEGEDEQGFHTVSVQCNSDEVVTGGGFEATPTLAAHDIKISKKQDNGWTVTSWLTGWGGTQTLIVYAECLKVVNEGTTG
jgi:hypothetical protein